MSKGSTRRPTEVDYLTYSRNWSRVFGESEPHKVSEPSTDKELEGSDNFVIKEAYRKIKERKDEH
jgi:hypothetical protein